MPHFCDVCAADITSIADNIDYPIEGMSICPSCQDMCVRECDDCGIAYYSAHTSRQPTICGDCQEIREQQERDEQETYERSSLVREYGFRVEEEFSFLGKPADGMYMGVELEIECVRAYYKSIAESVKEGLEQKIPGYARKETIAVMKEDASLDCGLEIVTIPLSYSLQKYVWKNICNTLSGIDGIKSHDTDTCGLHVHVTKPRVLTPLHIGKLVVFLNLPENKNFLAAFARRSDNSYAKFEKKKLTDHRGTERYEVLNLTNTNTVEFRLFKGSLKLQTILATLDFVHSLVKYTKMCSTKALGHKEYLLWLTKEGEYQDMKQWVKKNRHHIIN